MFAVWLTVLPVGFALFDEGAETFLGVFEAVEFVEEDVHGIAETVTEREAHAAENCFFGHGEDGAGVAGDTGAEVVDGGFELGLGNEAIDDAEIEGAFGGDGFAEEDEFEGDFGADEERKNRGRERRKNADGDFGLSEAGFRRGDHQIAECGEFRAAADGRTVDDANDGLGGFEDADEDGVKRVEHLENTLGGVFADVNAAAENLASGIEYDEFRVGALAGVGDAINQFAKHVFVEEIMVGTVEGHARNAGFEMEFYELKIGGIAAGGFGANLDVAIGKSCAACFHGSFSLRNGSRADGSMQGWLRLGGDVAKCAKSLLTKGRGRSMVLSPLPMIGKSRVRMRRTDGWWTTLSGR